MGWAFFINTKKEVVAPDWTGLVKCPSIFEKLSWAERALLQVEKIEVQTQDFISDSFEVRVYCEMPMLFAGTSGGMAAASGGSLEKLCFLVGALAKALRVHRNSFFPVPVTSWKGQLPKVIVKKRILKLLGAGACEDFKADTWDAVGIGLWVKGVFK